MTDAIFTEAEVADILGSTERRIAEWRRMYGWPHVRVGRTIRFTQTQVEQILAKHSQEATKPAVAAIPGQTRRSARRSA